jgi:hypothetical protein
LPQFWNHSELWSVRKLWKHFQLLPLSAWLYHTKQGCYITHMWEYIIPHFTLRTQQSPLFPCFWKNSSNSSCASFFIFRFAYYFWFSLNS